MRNLRTLGILGILLLLPACSTLDTLVKTKGNDIALRAVSSSEFTICEAQPVGVLMQKYPGERLFDWARFCNIRIPGEPQVPGVSLDNKGSL